MSISDEIGQRIRQARKNAGLTIQQLADQTGALKPKSISNYEIGKRTPGHQEISQIAEVLNVSPAYLMCFQDNKETGSGDSIATLGVSKIYKRLPILSLSAALNYDQILSQPQDKLIHYDHVVVSKPISLLVSENAFATTLNDDSMLPDFMSEDIIIVDPNAKPNPGKFVLAKYSREDKALLRKYKPLPSSTQKDEAFELIPLNEDWLTYTVKSSQDGKVLGIVVEHRRFV